MKNTTFLLVILPFLFSLARSYTLSDDNSTLCPYFFKNLTNSSYQGPNVSVEVNNFLLYSGHNTNDLGFYKICNDLPTQKYSLLQAEGLKIGLCGPAFCSINQLQNYTDTIIEFFSNITRRDLSSQLNIVFVDPDQTGLEQGFVLYFTIFVYVVLFGLVVVGTISSNSRKREKSLKESKVVSNSQNVSLREALMMNKDSSNDTVIVASNQLDLKTIPLQSRTSSQTKTPLHLKIIQCFDLSSNIKALLKSEEVAGHDQNLNVFNGIRALAFGWVVYGHTLAATATSAKNILYAELFLKSAWALILIAAFFAVDTFFFLSGFFTGFIMISKLRKMNFNLKNYLLLVFHRFIRLWPAYFIAILFYWKISVNFGSGPLWPSYVAGAQACDVGAWKNLLFLDNLFSSYSVYCFNWGWYLSCDFQMFLMTPFICWVYVKNRSRARYIIWTLIVISIMASYVYLADSNYTYILITGVQANNADYFMNYYVNPVVRMSPYMLGMWMGFIFKEYKEGDNNLLTWIKEGKVRSFICSFVGFGLLLFIVFFPRMLQTGGTWSTGFAQTWDAITRPAWTFGVFLLTAPCLVGNLPSLRDLLSNYYFTIIARVSYTGYLMHLVFLALAFCDMDQVYGMSQATAAAKAFAIMMLGITGGVILHLFIEKPVINIETRILNPRKSRENSSNTRNVKQIEA